MKPTAISVESSAGRSKSRTRIWKATVYHATDRLTRCAMNDVKLLQTACNVLLDQSRAAYWTGTFVISLDCPAEPTGQTPIPQPAVDYRHQHSQNRCEWQQPSLRSRSSPHKQTTPTNHIPPPRKTSRTTRLTFVILTLLTIPVVDFRRAFQ